MRYLLLLLLFTGCTSLKKKSVNLLSAGSMVEVKTTVDKDGTMSPKVFMGSEASIISSNAPVKNDSHSPTNINISRSYSLIDYFFGNTMGNICISYTSDKDINSYDLKLLLDIVESRGK